MTSGSIKSSFNSNVSIVGSMAKISESSLEGRPLPEILQMIVVITTAMLSLHICSLMIIDDDKKELEIRAIHGGSLLFRNKPKLYIWEGVSGWAIKCKKTIQIPDISSERTYRFPEIAKKEGIVSLICVPIKIGKKVIGLLNSYTSEPHVFKEEEVRVLEGMANQAALAIETHQLRSQNQSIKADLEKRESIDQAKLLLMEKRGLTEDEAYKLLQRTSQERHKPMIDVAKAIILSFSLDEKKMSVSSV